MNVIRTQIKNKMKKLFVSLLACAALAACSKEIEEQPAGPENPVFTGESIYMNVRICAANGTRAAEGDPNEFEYGTGDEHAVENAKFYFYSAQKGYVAEATVWNGGTPNTATNPVDNIELNSNTVVVLRGLTSNTSFPKYLVTVLNVPAGFEPGATLDEMLAKMAGGHKSGDKFIMSTTSFAGQTDADGAALPYYVTEVKAENLAPEPVAATVAKPVEVFVERLAAKVTVQVSPSLANDKVTLAGNRTLYKVNVTVGGTDNDQDDDNNTNVEIGADNIYVEFLGWKLNATAKDSYLIKHINEQWQQTDAGASADDETNTYLGATSDWVWNVKDFHRSYWGMSYNYGKTGYAVTEEPEANPQSEYLNYVTAAATEESPVIAMGASDYCNENTNIAKIAIDRQQRTSVLLLARICNEQGTALDMIRYNGILFTKGAYLATVLNDLNLNAFYKTTNAEGSEIYKQIDNTLVQLNDESVAVGLNLGTTTLYSRSGSAAPYTYTEITDTTPLQDALDTFNANSDAIGYAGGDMYYNIPIEHLRNDVDADKVKSFEANYGIVRNHHYVVSVNKLEKIGKGIYNPEEEIVPDIDDEKELYYVGASIHILSWKLVNQNVNL